MMEDGQAFAFYRVRGKGSIDYMDEDFTPEQILERRSYIRKMLIGTPFDNSPNNTLDCMRVWIDRDIGDSFVEDDKGYVYILPNKGKAGKEAEFRRIRAMMPPEYMNLTGKDFDWTKYGSDISERKGVVQKFIMNYENFQDKNMGLYIYSGTKGSGKTMLACCILNEISKRYVGSVKFINALDFLEMTKKGFNYDKPDVEALYMAKVLVIDDIGVQLEKEWINTVFYRLINSRYQNGKVTIYTSNMPINDLKMDDRIIDRIESTSFEVHLPEVPIRQQMRRAEKEKMMNEM